MRRRRPSAGLLLALGLLVVGAGVIGAPPAGAVDYRRGIDVSHWNGSIDLDRAYRAGQRFVFIKATESTDFVDRRYAANRRGARAAGFKVGAYHFAQPGRGEGDARREADHFLAHARPVRGDMLPVLDLEFDNGLSTIELKQWVWRYVRRIEERIGTKSIIYTYPFLWRDEMGDARAFANKGHKLWNAHWTSGQPMVPAANWSGRGMTFWQYSDCGSVSGLSGCVDLDRYYGTGFGPVLIPAD